MASSYALPASAMTHSHHGHQHHHSHSSNSPNRSSPYSMNTPRTLRQERSTGNLHSHTQSETHHHNHSHTYGRPHSHESAPQASSPLFNLLPTPPQSDGLTPGSATLEKHYHENTSEISQSEIYEPPHQHHHDHGHTAPLHSHAAHSEPRSRFTNFILPIALRSPLLYTILAEKDSRRIFYFMSLNFAFMIVQACYGFLTDSLGLLSDSIHMFFDCLALGVGLFAAVAAKWPPSERFPYGFGKIESLSGFGNGVFLMLISIEIMIEATERLAEGRPTKRLLELFVVSSLGLAVNLVGMACFGHHHHGHDHGGHSHGHDHTHSHSHSHSSHAHSHEKSHSHSHSHTHSPELSHAHSHDETNHHHDHKCNQSKDTPLLSSSSPTSPLTHASSHSHSHSHENENMHGIFLHVLADTMGSAAVMVSTALIYFIGWSGWDPIASCIIAILIFLSSIPLIKSSARKLLLTVPGDVEYSLRDALTGVSSIRGVASYAVPRFWLGDKATDVQGEDEKVLGVMHVVATRGSDLDDVRERTRGFLKGHGIDVVVQVERDGDVGCWCGGNSTSRSPSRF